MQAYSVESINIYVPEGGTIELKCPYLSTSTPVIWQSTHGLLFDGREVDHSLRIQNKMATVGNITIGQFNLKIFNVSSADVGYYVCGTYFGNETHQTRFNVHLAGNHCSGPKFLMKLFLNCITLENSYVSCCNKSVQKKKQ